MKVLQINSVYCKGSTGLITYQLHRYYLVSNIDSYVVFGRNGKSIESNVFKCTTELESNIHHFVSNIFDNPYGGCFFGTQRLIRIIKRIKPDIVHIHCINGYFVNIYSLLKYLGKHNIKTVLTNHGEFYYTGNCGSSFECSKFIEGCHKCPHIKDFNGKFSLDNTKNNYKKMKKAFSYFDSNNICITNVSDWVKYRSISSSILKPFKHVTVLNGINTDEFIYHNIEDTRKELSLPLDKNVYTFICSNWNENSKKEYFIQLANNCSDSIFVVIGAPKDAILPKNVINVGYIYNRKTLSKYLSTSDALISLSKRETFSLPVAEALCSGTPVIGFLSGGPETIGIKEYCQFVEYGNIDELRRLLQTEYKFDRKLISTEARKLYSINRMADGYLNVYHSLLDDYGK